MTDGTLTLLARTNCKSSRFPTTCVSGTKSMSKALFVLLLVAPIYGAAWRAVEPEAENPTRYIAGGRSPQDTDTVSTAIRVPPLGAPCGGYCGTERWDVKTLSDPDRDSVDLRPVDATVEELIELEPEGVAPRGFRYIPMELRVYRIEAYLGGAFQENDGDWHLVLFGFQNQRASLIAEIPDPTCAGACRCGFAEAFAEARQSLEDRLAQPNPRDEPIRVTVTGVGFFDRPHGQSGAAPNQFELHPVLRIEFEN